MSKPAVHEEQRSRHPPITDKASRAPLEAGRCLNDNDFWGYPRGSLQNRQIRLNKLLGGLLEQWSDNGSAPHFLRSKLGTIWQGTLLIASTTTIQAHRVRTTRYSPRHSSRRPKVHRSCRPDRRPPVAERLPHPHPSFTRSLQTGHSPATPVAPMPPPSPPKPSAPAGSQPPPCLARYHSSVPFSPPAAPAR